MKSGLIVVDVRRGPMGVMPATQSWSFSVMSRQELIRGACSASELLVVLPFMRASFPDCLGLSLLLRPGRSQGLVPTSAFSSSASSGLPSVAPSHRLWKTSSPTENGATRCLAIRGLVEAVSRLEVP